MSRNVAILGPRAVFLHHPAAGLDVNLILVPACQFPYWDLPKGKAWPALQRQEALEVGTGADVVVQSPAFVPLLLYSDKGTCIAR